MHCIGVLRGWRLGTAGALCRVLEGYLLWRFRKLVEKAPRSNRNGAMDIIRRIITGSKSAFRNVPSSMRNCNAP